MWLTCFLFCLFLWGFFLFFFLFLSAPFFSFYFIFVCSFIIYCVHFLQFLCCCFLFFFSFFILLFSFLFDFGILVFLPVLLMLGFFLTFFSSLFFFHLFSFFSFLVFSFPFSSFPQQIPTRSVESDCRSWCYIRLPRNKNKVLLCGLLSDFRTWKWTSLRRVVQRLFWAQLSRTDLNTILSSMPCSQQPCRACRATWLAFSFLSDRTAKMGAWPFAIGLQ